jgi:hypothetical protein
MDDLEYRNALRAARELWYDEQNLGELREDVVQGEKRGQSGVVVNQKTATPHDKTPRTWSVCPVRVARQLCGALNLCG